MKVEQESEEGQMAARTRVPHLSVDQRRAKGKEVRDRTPPSSHAGWAPATDRPDPIGLLEEQNRTREPDLVPVRHGRMLFSPFTFYRGTAKIMAADLDGTPTAGLQVQLCGDAHLSNFGVFASPERRLLFDLNDFDETLPGPFEYDVKRMAASFTIAGRNNGFSKADTRAATVASVAAYREAMASFAAMGTMDIWYAHLDEDELLRGIRRAAAEAAKSKKDAKAAKRARKTGEQAVAKAHTRHSLQALSKLGELVDGQYRIVSQPPMVVPMRDLEATYVPFADGAVWAGCRVGPADDPHDVLADDEAAGTGVKHPTEGLMTQDQPVAAWRRPPVGAAGDLGVGAADPDGQRFHYHRPQRKVWFGNLLQPHRPCRPGRYRHRLHASSPNLRFRARSMGRPPCPLAQLPAWLWMAVRVCAARPPPTSAIGRRGHQVRGVIRWPVGGAASEPLVPAAGCPQQGPRRRS
jgi:hypothetical protein